MRHRGGGIQRVHISVRHLFPRCAVFSPPRRYPELREIELEHLARTLLSDSSPGLSALKGKIKAHTSGQLLHAKDVLPALYELMGRDRPFEETPVQLPAPSKRAIAGGDWKRLKDALTRSLSSGSFLDSKFYALVSEPMGGPPTIRPIYFCSMVGDRTFLPKLVKCEFSASGLENIIKPLSDSSRVWSSSKTRLEYTNGYDSDLEDEGSGTKIPTDLHPHSAW
jgi:hypothetical protein